MKFTVCVPAAVMALSLFTSPAFADPHAQPRITVSASSDVTTAPDLATVSAGVVTRGVTAGEAMRENANLMSQVFEQLKSAGLAPRDIQTSQLSLQPKYDRQNRSEPRITGYEARNTVTARTFDLDNVGPMLDALVKAGVNTINGVQFGVRDPKTAQALARDAAIREARAKAQSMATSAGVRLGPLQSLSENSRSGRPQPMMMARSSMAMEADTPIAQGEQTISVTVNMVYEISQ